MWNTGMPSGSPDASTHGIGQRAPPAPSRSMSLGSLNGDQIESCAPASVDAVTHFSMRSGKYRLSRRVLPSGQHFASRIMSPCSS
jgi:hypothetical protein